MAVMHQDGARSSAATQAADVVALLRAVLGEALLGAWLHGSSVLGGLHPRSDLDILGVTGRPVTAGEREALVRGLLAISGRGRRRADDRPVELVLVEAAQLRPWRYPPVTDLLYGEWERDAYEAGGLPAPVARPDLVILLAMARAADRPLLGPPLATLLDPVPDADLRRAVADEAPGLLADLEPDTANVLLTLARAWVTLATGRVVPKDEAADWVLARLAPGERPAMARARDVYLGTARDRWEDLAAGLAPLADHLLAEIGRASGR